jgi:glycosyltransferase involved in cell wall biosynthesis
MDEKSKSVTLVYKSLPHYRVPLYEGIRERLAEEGLQFRLVYGQPSADEVRKKDTADLPWGHAITNRTIRLGHRTLYWQPCLRLLRGSDLVIVEQASKLLLNYLLLAQQSIGKRRVALWGHGRNFQEKGASRFGEVVKKRMSRHVHWWFAYNEKSADVVRSLGFPPERITVVQNSIDTRLLIEKQVQTNQAELSHLRSMLDLQSTNVGVFVGGLYEDKRLDFLVEAAIEIRRRVPDFELLVVGAGPQEDVIEAARRKNPWIRWVGAKFDADKVPYIMLAKVMVVPAWVGLVVIDSFALGVPLVTVDSEAHPPEVDYLRHGTNGMKLPAESGPQEYAAAVEALLRNDSYRARLGDGCRAAADKYTMEEMIERFAKGISDAVRT